MNPAEAWSSVKSGEGGILDFRPAAAGLILAITKNFTLDVGEIY